MKPTPFSIYVFGIYMILVPGLGLMFLPAFMLDMFNMAYDPTLLWPVRMIGLLASIIGAFDILTAKHEVVSFYKWTVRLRYYAAAFMIALFALKQVEAAILIFAAVDALGATWTMLTLRNQSRISPK